MSNIVEEIAKIRKESEALKNKADRLESLLKDYPDLHRRVDRWNKEFFCSKEVNAKATDCHIHHTCGCCSDAPLIVKPFIKLEDGMWLYGDPLDITIGEKNPYRYGDDPYPGWKEKLEQAGYNPKIIEQVEAYFGYDPYAEDQEEEQDDGVSS